MTNNTGKEKWIDDVLNSVQGISRIHPQGVYDNAMANLNKPRTVTHPFPAKRWAAAAILLLALNIGSAIYYKSNIRVSSNASSENPLASQFESSSYNY